MAINPKLYRSFPTAAARTYFQFPREQRLGRRQNRQTLRSRQRSELMLRGYCRPEPLRLPGHGYRVWLTRCHGPQDVPRTLPGGLSFALADRTQTTRLETLYHWISNSETLAVIGKDSLVLYPTLNHPHHQDPANTKPPT